MQLINNELVYDEGDIPKDFSFVDWKYLVPVLKSISNKILDVEQRGIYEPDVKSFALQVSGTLTEQEQVDILTAWTNFDSTSEKLKEKNIATEELRISLGIKTKAYMGYLCEVYNLTISNYEDMFEDTTLILLDRLLLSGALETSKNILDAYVPTSYFTIDFQTALSAKLQEHIDQVNTFINS